MQKNKARRKENENDVGNVATTYNLLQNNCISVKKHPSILSLANYKLEQVL